MAAAADGDGGGGGGGDDDGNDEPRSLKRCAEDGEPRDANALALGDVMRAVRGVSRKVDSVSRRLRHVEDLLAQRTASGSSERRFVTRYVVGAAGSCAPPQDEGHQECNHFLNL